jgi:hypothetical protein
MPLYVLVILELLLALNFIFTERIYDLPFINPFSLSRNEEAKKIKEQARWMYIWFCRFVSIVLGVVIFYTYFSLTQQPVP